MDELLITGIAFFFFFALNWVCWTLKDIARHLGISNHQRVERLNLLKEQNELLEEWLRQQ